MTQPYPSLGFNPTPGTLDAVTGMQTKLASSADALEQAYRMVERLRAGVSWEGDAAVAFREQLDGSLSNNLKNAHASLLKAATALGGWQQELSGFQDRAKTLEGDAKTAHDSRRAVGRFEPTRARPGRKRAHSGRRQRGRNTHDRHRNGPPRRSRACPMLAHITIYPSTDLTRAYPSHDEFADGYLLTKAERRWYYDHYRPVVSDVRASPLLGNLAGLPPAVVLTAGLDPVRDEGRAYAAGLITAGVPTAYREAEGNIHAFVLLRQAVPSSQRDIAEAIRALREAIDESLRTV